MTREDGAGAGGWQPISTAPKDGTRVLVCKPIKTGSPKKYGIYISRWNGLYWAAVNPAIYQNGPTHWMPLPLPPTQETGSE
jgi:uncharacterized protein DUF551